MIGKGHMASWHLVSDRWQTGRKFRRYLLERNQGTLERAAEDGARFVSLRQMASAGRIVVCPCGTALDLSVNIPGLPFSDCTAFRVPGGWTLVVSPDAR